MTGTDIRDLYIIEPMIYEDKRGYFMESFNKKEFQQAGFMKNFVQDNQSLSSKGVLRGLHYQYKYPQDKLVRVLEGIIYDVAVDIRKGSETFGRYQGVILSEDNKKQFYIPVGFAHGFLVLSDRALVLYKTTSYYHGEYDAGIRWDDPDIGIDWPRDKVDQVNLSDKDGALPYLKEIDERRLFIL